MSLIDPWTLKNNPELLEQVERASTRYVAYAVNNMLDLAREQFASLSAPTPGASTSDAANYLGEDLTRMALDQIGTSRVPGGRLFGAIDYKAAVLQFLPEFAIEQALFVDSKAEKGSYNNCRVQITQTSMIVRQTVAGVDIAVPGLVDPVWVAGGHIYLTSTLFVKYHYGVTGLRAVTVAALPHAFVQDKYNPNPQDGIWNVGPNAPTLGESFRTRLNFSKLEAKAPWRVQRMTPGQPWEFRD